MAQTFKPPKSVRNNAKRGLELRKKYGRGGLSTQEAGKQGIGSGVARARDLANGKAISLETINRMVSFFARHEKNKDSRTENGEPGAGMISHLLWGGDAGRRWAEGIKKQMEKQSYTEVTNILYLSQAYLVRAQTDAPNYKPASEKEDRCATCRFFDWQRCSRYDFAADPDYICGTFKMREPEIEYRALVDFPGIYKAEQHTGAMVALFVPPSVANEISIPGGEEPEELHITLAFLGQADDIPDKERLLKTVWLWAKSQSALTGRINGGGWFANDQTVLYASPDVAWLPEFSSRLTRALEELAGVEIARDHGYIPHITLMYQDGEPEVLDIPTLDLSFTQVSVVLAGERFDFPLEGPVVFKALVEQYGARNSRVDSADIQAAHDLTVRLGAICMRDEA